MTKELVTRRAFTAALGTAGLSMLWDHRLLAQDARASRTTASVGRIDTHHHILPPEYVRLVGVSGGERVAKLSWDSIFACLGPTMFDEASEGDLEKTLEGKIAADAGLARFMVDVRDEDFQTIKVQLRGLGLIQKSVKKRSLKDTDTYWALTPYGEHYATVLKAIPREEGG